MRRLRSSSLWRRGRASALCPRAYGAYLSSGDFDGTTVLNPEAYERIEVAVNDVLPEANLLAAERPQPAAAAAN
jgi:hypothetical protein